MVFSRIKSIGALNNVKISDMCLVFKRNVDLSREDSVATINFKNHFPTMSFSNFYKTGLELKDFIGKKGDNIKHDQVLNIPENSNIPLNGEISIRNFENSKQYDILECEFNGSTDADCTNIDFFDSVNLLANSKIIKLNHNIDIIKYKIPSTTPEIVSVSPDIGAIDVNFANNIFTNLIIIDIYTDTLITGDHGESVSGTNANDLDGGDGYKGNKGSSAIIFKNVPSGIKAYVYQNGDQIIGGFGSDGGNGGNAGKKAMSEPYIAPQAEVPAVTGKYQKTYNIDAGLFRYNGVGAQFIKKGFWAMHEGGGNIYFGIFNNNKSPELTGWLFNDDRSKGKRKASTTDDIRDILKSNYVNSEGQIELVNHSDWTALEFKSFSIYDNDYGTQLANWDGWGSTGNRFGVVGEQGTAYLYAYGPTAPPDITGSGGSYVTTIATHSNGSPAINRKKGHQQTYAPATNAKAGKAAIVRTHNAKKSFSPSKGSTGSPPGPNARPTDADETKISYELKNPGQEGTGGNPGSNAQKISIVSSDYDMYYELITIPV
jgi:hypothetical protein